MPGHRLSGVGGGGTGRGGWLDEDGAGTFGCYNQSCMLSSPFNPTVFSVNGRDMILASDAARLGGVSSDYITRLCRTGKLAGACLASGWFVEKISLRQFLADRAAKFSSVSSARETFVRPRDVARKVGLSADYILRLCRDGIVDGRLISGTWFVNRESLRVFVANARRRKKETRAALSLLRRLQQQK